MTIRTFIPKTLFVTALCAAVSTPVHFVAAAGLVPALGQAASAVANTVVPSATPTPPQGNAAQNQRSAGAPGQVNSPIQTIPVNTGNQSSEASKHADEGTPAGITQSVIQTLPAAVVNAPPVPVETHKNAETHTNTPKKQDKPKVRTLEPVVIPVVSTTTIPAATSTRNVTRMATTTSTSTSGAYTHPSGTLRAGALSFGAIGTMFFPSNSSIYRSNHFSRSVTVSLLLLALAMALSGVLLLVGNPLRYISGFFPERPLSRRQPILR